MGRHDGAPYVVTELLEGETLRERLRSGALPVRKAVESRPRSPGDWRPRTSKGIVHRDLKPENLFVTGTGGSRSSTSGSRSWGVRGRVRPDGGGDAVGARSPGAVLGTMGYMSPEQVRQPADQRSDLFAFGTILYEMLAGQRAFRGATAADTMTAILTKEPPELSDTSKAI